MSFSSLAVPWVTFRIRQWLRTAGSCAAPQVRRSTPDAGARPLPSPRLSRCSAHSRTQRQRARSPWRRGPGLIFRIVRGCRHQHADAPHALALLRPRRERPRRRAAEQRDELAPIHSITSSARPSSGSGTASPSVLAVLLASLARPGGMSLLVPELKRKAPGLAQRTDTAGHSDRRSCESGKPGHCPAMEGDAGSGSAMGIALRLIEVRERDDLDGAVSAAAQANVNAVDVLRRPGLSNSLPSSRSSIGCRQSRGSASSPMPAVLRRTARASASCGGAPRVMLTKS